MQKSQFKIGLVFSGGGAKGAYEIGVLKALEEHGLAKYIRIISGCSIGAYNELLYTVCGLSAVRSFLWSFPELTHPDPDGSETLCGKKARYGSRKLRQYMLDILDENRFRNLDVTLYACAYSVKDQKPEYFLLNGRPLSQAVDICIASGSLPDLFPPVVIDGSPYTDGGVVPAEAAACGTADKIPVFPAAKGSPDCVLVIFLNPENTVNTSCVPVGCLYREIRPSEPLEDSPSSGTLDFSPEKLIHHEKLGYSDMNEQLLTLETELSGIIKK